jgi:hypothetical protein
VKDPQDSGALHYALGRAYDGLGDYDRAFAAYEKGGSILRAERTPDWTQADAVRDAALNEFTRDLQSRLSPSVCASDRSIIVTGLPRSGTTLVEHILCAHSEVGDGAEHALFQPAVFDLQFAAPGAVAAYQQKHGARAWTEAGETYVSLVADRYGSKRIVDKTMLNTRMLGAIAQAVPKAPIIWLRRDPMDNAWSCFRTKFFMGHDWTWSLTDIARYFRDEDRLWHHWTGLLGDRVLTVPYEELVASSDLWTRRILDHCGLAYEEGVAKFHESDRVISTASLAQVRQPVSTSAIGQWRNYERHMKPFVDAYRA